MLAKLKINRVSHSVFLTLVYRSKGLNHKTCDFPTKIKLYHFKQSILIRIRHTKVKGSPYSALKGNYEINIGKSIADSVQILIFVW